VQERIRIADAETRWFALVAEMRPLAALCAIGA